MKKQNFKIGDRVKNKFNRKITKASGIVTDIRFSQKDKDYYIYVNIGGGHIYIFNQSSLILAE
jgi:hypothetical protein